MSLQLIIDIVDHARREAGVGRCSTLSRRRSSRRRGDRASASVAAYRRGAASARQNRAKRSRTKKANGASGPAPEPVATAPEPAVTTSEPVTALAPQPEPAVPAESDEELRERFRLFARERGVKWLRPLLKERGVEKLSALSIEQVKELLHVVA